MTPSHLINHPENKSHGLREDFTSAASGASPSGTGCGVAVFELDRAPREEPLRNTHAQQLGGMPWGSVRAQTHSPTQRSAPTTGEEGTHGERRAPAELLILFFTTQAVSLSKPNKART